MVAYGRWSLTRSDRYERVDCIKKIINEITSDIRPAKVKYFKDQFSEIATTKAHRNLLTKATKPKVRNSIGPLRREDKSFAVEYSEKANVMNEFFATVGSRLAEGYDQRPVPIAINPVPVSQISNISLSTNIIMKKPGIPEIREISQPR